MSNQQVLKEVIEKAIERGWDPHGLADYEFWMAKTPVSELGIAVSLNPAGGLDVEIAYEDFDYHRIIFDHEFCKALWGEEFIISHKANSIGQVGSWHEPAWRHHLSQLAIAEDRIEYLRLHALGGSDE